MIERNWDLLVEQIQSGNPVGVAEAYDLFGTQIRKQIRAQLGSYQLSERTHEAFLGLVSSIRESHIREPARLRGFVKTVINRKVLEFIGEMVKERRTVCSEALLSQSISPEEGPEEMAIVEEQTRLLNAALRGLRPKEEEVLRRFYLEEQPEDQIRAIMDLTPTQFRLLKSRSLDRIAKISERLKLYPVN